MLKILGPWTTGHITPNFLSIFVADGFGNFTITIRMSRTGSFDSYYTSYPINANINDRLFPEVSLRANSTDIVLLIDECYATPSKDKNDAIKFTLIKKM